MKKTKFKPYIYKKNTVIFKSKHNDITKKITITEDFEKISRQIEYLNKLDKWAIT